MKQIGWQRLTTRRVLGVATMVLGATVLFLPIFIGEWVIALLGVLLIVAGLFQFVEVFRTAGESTSYMSYGAGVVTILLGIMLFFSPGLVLSGLLIAVTLFFLADGGIKLFGAYKQTGSERWWGLFNGIFSIALGLLLWYFLSANLGLAAIGVILGLRLLAEGWTMLFLPEKGFEPPDAAPDLRYHPDLRLGLPPSDTIKTMRTSLLQSDTLDTYKNIVWCLSLLAIFFVIHLLRTGAQWTFIGFIAPFVAVAGDAAVALLLAIVLLLPLRLVWRAASRPVERVAWNRLYQLREKALDPTIGEKALEFWLETGMKFTLELRKMSYSLNFAFWRLMRLGLPLTAILIAINSIWGFSWYFNSENWASAVWQEATKERVDVWREQQAEVIEQQALANGVTPEQVFAIEPAGVEEAGDFSFVVIGDTGEGDPSQMSLRNQLIAANNRDPVKFLVLSSDVIYPDGKMKDYETNFYLPFHGFEKPIYAIPGNHDWFDANEGFNANFFEPDAALLALQTRLAIDMKTNLLDDSARFTEMVGEARRLRDYYRIKNGQQRAPFFELHTADFSLIAIDTGILRRVDPKQMAWLEAALARAGDNFKMVVIGHPMYAAGVYQAENDPTFDELHTLLQRHQVAIVMGGDTHDFEFYREEYGANSQENEMLHFVNGGGGAYLSIGTVLDFPDAPAVADYAFYPRTDELWAKMENETPLWQRPFLLWIKWFNGYPVSAEWLSGVFDFNQSPFFQSFMEVKVERSQNRVRLLLYGVDGQLRWRDLQLGGQVIPAGQSDDDFVEFIVPLGE